MITAAQMRAARALLGIDQRELAERSGLSLPTIQRMEASDGVIRGNVDSTHEVGRRACSQWNRIDWRGLRLKPGWPRGAAQMSTRRIAIDTRAKWRC